MTGTGWVVLLIAVLGAGAGRLIDALAVVAPRRADDQDGGPALRTALRRRALGAPWPELATALAAGAVTARFGWSAQLPAWLWFVAVGALLVVVDLRTQLLPNRVLLPAVVGGVLLLTTAAGIDDSWGQLGRAALGGGVAFAVLLALVLVAPSGMGVGDVKLAGLLGLYLGWLGWPALVTGLFLGFLVQAVLGLALIAARRASRKTQLPFGPALVLGTLAAALLS